MDNLKSAIADKVLEISTSDNNEIKTILDKINRFRDFVDACQTLIKKYPAIETELLHMIEENDFDARVASSRVDTIIRLSETDTVNKEEEKSVTQVEEIKEEPNNIVEVEQIISSAVTSTNQIDNTPIQETSKELPKIEIEEQKEYIDFEEIASPDKNAINIPEDPIISSETKSSSEKKTGKKIVLISGIIAIIVILFFIIKFVINNWELLLWVSGGCIVAACVVWILLKKTKSN